MQEILKTCFLWFCLTLYVKHEGPSACWHTSQTRRCNRRALILFYSDRGGAYSLLREWKGQFTALK